MTSSSMLDYVTGHPWLLHKPVAQQFHQVLLRHVKGEKLSDEAIAAIVAARDAGVRAVPSKYSVEDGVGIVPITGVIARHAHMVNGMSQPRGTSISQLDTDLKKAVDDPNALSIALMVDSPGGSVDGLIDMADRIARVRGKKPIVTIASGMMASAAYWLGSQTDRVYATRGTIVGSIGVITWVVDDHRAYEAAGYDVSYITTGAAKAAGASGKTQTPEDFEIIRAEINGWYDAFVEAVAKSRGIDAERARQLADGRVHLAAAALELGLIDEIADEASLFDSLRERATSRAAASIPRTEDMTNPQPKPGADAGGSTPTPAATAAPAAQSPPPAAPAASAPSAAEIAAQAIKTERERVSFIMGKAGPGQESLASKLVADGATREQALEALLANATSRLSTAFAKHGEATGSDAQSHAATHATTAKASTGQPQTTDEKWAAMTSDQHAEFFGDKDLFAAYERGVAKGAINNPRRESLLSQFGKAEAL